MFEKVSETTAIDTIDENNELLNEQDARRIAKKSVAGAFSYFFRTILLTVFGLFTSLVLSAYLTPEDFGVYGYVIQFVGLLVFFSDIGLAATLIQKKTEPTLQEYRVVFTVQQLLSWFIFLLTVLLVLTGIIERTVGEVGNWILLALGISFPLASLKTISAIQLERELDFSKLVVPQIVETVVFNVVLMLGAVNHFGAMVYVYAILARSIVGFVSMWLIKPWSIGIHFSLKNTKHLWNFGAQFQLNDFLARIKDNLSYIVFAKMMSPAEFGYVSWAKQWSMYPYNMTVGNVMAITFPTFSRLQGNTDMLKRAIEKSLFFITLTIFPILSIMCVFIFPLVALIERYQRWEPALSSFLFFTLGIAFSAVSSPLTNTLNAIGKVGTTLKLMILWTVLTWTITPVAIWLMGYEGVAVASFIIATTSFLPAILLKRIMKLNLFDQVWRQLVAVTLMSITGIGLIGWAGQSFTQLFLAMFGVSIVYGGSLLLVGRQKLLTEIHSVLKK